VKKTYGVVGMCFGNVRCGGDDF